MIKKRKGKRGHPCCRPLDTRKEVAKPLIKTARDAVAMHVSI